MKQKTTSFILILLLLTSAGGRADAGENPDKTKAFLLSLVIPGAGQYYAGSPGYGKLFIAVELAIWGGYFYNTTIKDASRQDYYSQAALHAGVNPSGFGASYLNAIGAYNSSYEHNIRKLQSSVNPVLYTGEQTWAWDSEESRLRFRNLRERELDYENNAKFYIAGIVLNHFLAALHASNRVQNPNSTGSSITVNVLNHGLSATYLRSF